MSKSDYFKVQKLNKEFNKAMSEGNIKEAKRIDIEINAILYRNEQTE